MANIQKVAERPIASISVRKNWLTNQALNQFTAVATETALPRTRLGNTSLIIVQVTGPSENAKLMMNTTRATRVMIPAALAEVGGGRGDREGTSGPPMKRNAIPTVVRLVAIPTSPISNSGFRPNRSM